MKKILYLHGFNSSPLSMKARALKGYLDAQGRGDAYACPELPPGPADAMRVIESLVAQSAPDDLTVVGSSLGGFYATHLTEKYGFRSVLVNPGVFAHDSLKPYVGPQTNLYSGAQYEFTRRHVDELAAMAHAKPGRIERYWVLVETNDETLDYREAVAFYRGARQLVVQGGDHGFQSWTRVQRAVVAWAGLR